jgi:hypothetical protein
VRNISFDQSSLGILLQAMITTAQEYNFTGQLHTFGSDSNIAFDPPLGKNTR